MNELDGRMLTGGIKPMPELEKSVVAPNVEPVKLPGPTTPPVPPEPVDELTVAREFAVAVMMFPEMSLMFETLAVTAAPEVRRSPESLAVRVEASYEIVCPA